MTDSSGVDYETPSPENVPCIQYGWVCPLCNSVYSPTVTDCFRCNGPRYIITSGEVDYAE